MDRDYEVFISYRHKAANDLAKILYNEFQSKYSVNSFRDDEELHFGDFRKQLLINNKKSRYLVLLLTPGMLDRCKRPNDWITIEISNFLKRGKPIIPIKIDGFEFPEDLSVLPEEIRDVVKYDSNSLCCTTNDLNKTAEDIAAHVYKFLRKNWSDKDCADAIESKEYLSRHNRRDVGKYFYHSALRFRKYAFLFGMQLMFLILECSLNFDGFLNFHGNKTFLSILFGFLSLCLIFFEFEKMESKIYKHPVYFADIILDHSLTEILSSLTGGFLLWFFLLMFIYGGISLVNIFFSAMFSDSEAFLCANSYLCIFLGCFRLLFKFIISFVDFLNSLISPYPKNYKIRKISQKISKIGTVAGWWLIGPVIIFCNYLACL